MSKFVNFLYEKTFVMNIVYLYFCLCWLYFCRTQEGPAYTLVFKNCQYNRLKRNITASFQYNRLILKYNRLMLLYNRLT